MKPATDITGCGLAAGFIAPSLARAAQFCPPNLSVFSVSEERIVPRAETLGTILYLFVGTECYLN